MHSQLKKNQFVYMQLYNVSKVAVPCKHTLIISKHLLDGCTGRLRLPQLTLLHVHTYLRLWRFVAANCRVLTARYWPVFSFQHGEARVLFYLLEINSLAIDISSDELSLHFPSGLQSYGSMVYAKMRGRYSYSLIDAQSL